MTNELIKKIRLVLGLTQKEFAHEIGVSELTIIRWELGKTTPSKIACKALLNFLKNIENVTLEELIEESREKRILINQTCKALEGRDEHKD